jgi:biotin synthase
MTRQEIIDLLRGDGSSDEALFAAARDKRNENFGQAVVLRGVIEMTNRCRVNCDFCPMRRDNSDKLSLFTLTDDDLVHQSRIVRAENINVVFIQGGEIPQSTAVMERAIPRIIGDSNSPVEILLNLGSKSRSEYKRLKDAGATSYILKHETSNPELYRLHKHQALDERLKCLSDLLELGFRVGTGTIVGLPGQTIEDLADDILLAHRLGVHMTSASPFLPARETPLAHEKPGSVEITLRAIAISRLLMPGALIPSVSALEASHSGGQARGLQAGANVLTINFTPTARVEQYLIYGSERHIVKLNYVRNLLREQGLVPGLSLWA